MKRRYTPIFILLGTALSLHLLFGGKSVDDADIKALLNDGALLIDVRTPQEFSSGHIDGALNIPYDRIGNRIHEQETDYDRSIIVYCRSGRRSSIAKNTLEEMGYRHVVNAGGYRDVRKKMAQEKE